MNRRNVAAALLAITAALACARLGFWQIDRHEARKEYNARVAERRLADPVPLERTSGDTTSRYRRVEASGVFDYTREIVQSGRTRQGSPGVHVLTPLLLPGDTQAVLVNRGWVYSPDAARADLDPWRESDTVQVRGYLELLDADAGGSRAELAPGVWHRLDPDSLQQRFPYELLRVQLVAAELEPEGERAPARVGIPPLDGGPHLSYAFQWFAFGTIALVGGGVLIAQNSRRRR